MLKTSRRSSRRSKSGSSPIETSTCYFALLTDFRDANEETLPEDELLLRLAQKRIEELNGKYRDSGSRCVLSVSSPAPMECRGAGLDGIRAETGQACGFEWACSEAAHADRFSLIVGETAVLSAVQYVITLDTDTQLPRDAAWQFVGTMAHPLNRARYDEHKQRVCDGYGILQPRVAVSLPGTNRSRYARLNGSDPGIDPYTRAISDVYQDVFGEGSFIGKGIYEVDAFEHALAGRFPENRILSHDLLEGCYARAGLLSDVHLYEEYPSCYSVDVSRRHRWIRGDWQLAGWLLPRVPGPGAQRQNNPLSGLSRWKLFDNLRRSLVPSALTVLLLLGWTVLSPFWLWTFSVLGVILIPPCTVHGPGSLSEAGGCAAGGSMSMRCYARQAGTLFRRCSRSCAFPTRRSSVWMRLCARSGGCWSRSTRLLEWSPSSDSDRNRRTDLVGYCRTMWIGPVLATAAVIYLTPVCIRAR